MIENSQFNATEGALAMVPAWSRIVNHHVEQLGAFRGPLESVVEVEAPTHGSHAHREVERAKIVVVGANLAVSHYVSHPEPVDAF